MLFVVFLAGLAVIVAGVAQVYAPAAYIVAGVFAASIALFLELGRRTEGDE